MTSSTEPNAARIDAAISRIREEDCDFLTAETLVTYTGCSVKEAEARLALAFTHLPAAADPSVPTRSRPNGALCGAEHRHGVGTNPFVANCPSCLGLREQSRMTPSEHPMATIAGKLGPEGVGLVAELMDQNRRDQEWVDNCLRESAEADRDRWKERALAAEDQLERIRGRVNALIFGEVDFDEH